MPINRLQQSRVMSVIVDIQRDMGESVCGGE